MRTAALLFASALFCSPLLAGPVETYDGPRDAVVAAKQAEGGKAIIFLLTESFSDDTAVVEGILKTKLLGMGHEFVISKCRESAAAEKAMFVERFEQDISVLPLAVATTVDGKLLGRAAGTDEDEYEKMITVARINAGFEKDPEKISEALESYGDEEGDEFVGDSIFGMRKRDIGNKKILLTPQRTWTFVDGRTFEAALLEATGQQGTFVLADDTQKKLNFNDFSDNDKAYLQALLAN